ncbi:MAG: arsenosugar biosynthesis radical SAM (seleno)protein ArsS [Bacteroidota bacterium]|nr:arsenosugar biosynthesis radical SAM (seleno)protein ArsS [Bacteroidota bacterium]
MHPDFKWFVQEIRSISRDVEVIVRSNLTILNENAEFETYPDFFREHRLTIISSMPCYTLENVDSQRGDGVYNRSISALKALNEKGYGKEGSGLELHLVYNPGGTALPGSQLQLQKDYKQRLMEDHGIEFNNLYTITNIPINRFLVYLKKTGKYEEYMQRLIEKFNPSAAMGVMCRDTVSVAWDGSMYDCDFNQQLELDMQENIPRHIKDFDFEKLSRREIMTGQHCFGCTAGEGSSCQGALDPG